MFTFDVAHGGQNSDVVPSEGKAQGHVNIRAPRPKQNELLWFGLWVGLLHSLLLAPCASASFFVLSAKRTGICRLLLNSWRLDYTWWTFCFIVLYIIGVDWFGWRPPNPPKPTPVSEDSITLLERVMVEACLNILNRTMHQAILNYPLHLLCTLNQTILNCLLRLFCILNSTILNHTLNSTE